MSEQQLVLQPGQTCDSCGGEFVRGTKKHTVTYQGCVSDEFEMPRLRYIKCAEGIVDLQDMKLLQKAQNLLKGGTQAELPKPLS